MSEEFKYGEAIERSAHKEYLDVEEQLRAATAELTRIASEEGYDAVPEALVLKITELQQRSTLLLKDWLESWDLA